MKCDETLTQKTMKKYPLNIQFDEEYFYKERFSFNIHAPNIQITKLNLKDLDIYLPHLNSLLTEIFKINSARCKKTKKKKILLKSKCIQH